MSPSLLLRIIIAVTALGVAAARLWWPELRVDLTFVALIAVAMIVLFGRGIRIKTLELLGLKVEFDQSAADTQAPPPATQPPQDQRYQPDASIRADTYIDRILKLTPVETIAGYLMIITITKSLSLTNYKIVGLSFFVIFLTATYIYFTSFIIIVRKIQVVFMTLSFAAWAYALGGPFEAIGWYVSEYAALALALVFFGLPVIPLPPLPSNEKSTRT